MCTYVRTLGSFLSSWQLFLSDSMAMDNALQSSADYGIRKLIPISKPSHSPSRLSFFVSLSNRGNAKNIPQKQNYQKNIPGNCDDVLKFKSPLLSTATCGLVLHPISTYYPPTNPSLPGPNNQNFDDESSNTHTHRVQRTSNTTSQTIYKSSSPLEISARKKAVTVLESMVQGLDLSKWFLSSSSTTTSQSRSSAGSKVKEI